MAAEGKRKRVYFQPKMDIVLLVEVLQHNPYRHGNAVYGTITQLLRQREDFRDVERRTLQDRVERLLKTFRSEDLAGMKRSGTEEEYDERERLLQEISDLEEEWAPRKREAATTAAEVRIKAARVHAVGRPMLTQLATTLRPVMTLPGTDGEAVVVPEPEVDDTNDDPPGSEEVGQNAGHQQLPRGRTPWKSSSSPAARWSSTLSYMEEKRTKEEESKKAALERQKEELQLKKNELEVRKLEAANECLRKEAQVMEQQRMADMEEERRKEEREERKLEMQKEELQLKKDELEVRKLEAANERLRIETHVREQQRMADMEEERRKEEREERELMMDRQNNERKEMMDRQNKLMDAMLQLIQATTKK